MEIIIYITIFYPSLYLLILQVVLVALVWAYGTPASITNPPYPSPATPHTSVTNVLH